MQHLEFYVSDVISRQLRQRAVQAGISLSRYLAELVKRDTYSSANWPEGYFKLFGTWQGAPLERFPQNPSTQPNP